MSIVTAIGQVMSILMRMVFYAKSLGKPNQGILSLDMVNLLPSIKSKENTEKLYFLTWL